MEHRHRPEHLFTSTLGGEIRSLPGLTREALVFNAAGVPLLLLQAGLSRVARARAVRAAITQVLLLTCEPDDLDRVLRDLVERRAVGVREE